MSKTQQPFIAVTTTQLDQVSGGSRNATSPSQNHQERSLSKIQRELDGMSGGGDQMMLMMMMMQMLGRDKGDQVTEVDSPGLLGAIWGGTTKLR